MEFEDGQWRTRYFCWSGYSQSQAIEHEFVIADIEAPVILGLDFLKQHYAIIVAHNQLILDGVAHQCYAEAAGTYLSY